MPGDPRMRASDDDRDRTATLLQEHHAAGRLTAEEFQERLDATYAAKTLGDLDEIMSDLPHVDLYKLPEASLRRMQASRPQSGVVRAPQHGRLSPAWRAAWGSWASVNLLLFVIWLLSSGGHFSYPWFLWVAGPWGAILLARWVFDGHPSGKPRQPERQEPPDQRPPGNT
ncbi:MAG TPA: DUF1707 domain-containing protein [Streptosporangiaceae bacterium]|nr:DUF1707 domain-containing protein [Streptosporangiaceae bacterium]